MATNNKKQQKKKMLFLLLMSSIWAGVVTGIVLRDNNKGDIDIKFYDYNKDGDLLITLILPGTKYKEEKVSAVFVDDKGNEYSVPVSINIYNKGQIDTSLLPNGNNYHLNRVVDENKNTIISNQNLYQKQKIKIQKPTQVENLVSDENNKLINVNLNKELSNKIVRATFVDENSNEFFVEGIVDSDGSVIFETNTLVQGHVYKLNEIHLLNTKPLQKVANLSNIDEHLLLVDKTRSFNVDGDIVVDVNLKDNNVENFETKSIIGIFKDSNNIEYPIKGIIDKKGVVHFDTSSLKNNNEYKIERIEDELNNILVSNDKLSKKHKNPIVKPNFIDVNYFEINDKNDSKIKLKVDPVLGGISVIATLVDQNNKTYQVEGLVDKNGLVVFDTKDLEQGNEYILTKVSKKTINQNDNLKVVNLNLIDEVEKLVDKTRHFDDDGDIVIDVNFKKEKYANKEVIAIFVDAKNNKYEVNSKINSNEKLQIPTTTLPNNVVLSLNSIVDKKTKNSLLSDAKNNETTNLDLNVLSNSHKDTFSKPPKTNIFRNDENKKIITFDLEESLYNETVVANYYDTDGNLFSVENKVGKDGKLQLNVFELPKGKTYELKSLTQKDSNPLVKVANVKTIAPEYKIIDNSHDLSNEGNTEIIVQTNESNKDVSAVFVDEKGVEHKIPARIDENGLLVIDTKDLPSPGKYNLEKVVDANDATIVAKDDLNDYQKLPVIKPSQVWISTNPTNNEPILNIATNNPSRSGEVFDAEFVDQNGNKYKVPAKMDENGVIKIDTSSLPQGNSYKLKDVHQLNTQPLTKVTNLKKVPEELLKVDKTRSFNSDGDVVVDVNLKTTGFENLADKPLVAIFKVKGGNEFKVTGQLNKKGIVHFDTSSLPQGNEYKLNRIEDDKNNVLVDNQKLSDDHKNPIKKPTPIVISKDNEGNKIVEVKLGKELANHAIELSVIDSNGNTHKFDAIADANGKIKFDVSKLAEPELYKIDSITKKDSNPVIKVVNLDDVSNQNKTINKLNVDELNKPRNYDKDGDIVIKAKTDPLNFGEQVEAIFVDQDNNEHKVIAVVDENGNMEINTSSLPNNKSYNLKEIVSINDANKKIVADHDLANTQKDKLNKPNATIAYDGANNQLNLSNLDKDLNNQPITVTLKDHTDKELTLKGVVDANGNVSFDTSNLPLNAIYEITKITKDSDPNQPVVNLNDVSKDQKIINKIQTNQNNNDAIKQNDNGDSVIEIDLNNSSISDADKQKLKEDGNKAVFVDQNGNKHEVNVSIDGDKLVIDTAKLPSPGTYTLYQIVDKDNNPILEQNELSDTAKQPIVKPNVVVSVDENKNVHVEFKDKNLVNKDVVGVFVDKEGNEHKIPARIDANGNVVFDTSSLPENNKYVLNKIVDPNNNDQKVANLDHINEEDRTVSKLNNGSINDANNNHLIDVPNKKSGDVVEVHYKDKDGNTVVVEKTVNDNGKVEIDPTQNPPFDPNKIYDFDKIVDPTTLPNEILVDKNDVNDKVDDINNDKTLARKIIFNDIFANPLTPTVSRVSVKLKDVNHLANNKQFVLTIVKKDDPTKTKKFVATLNENTDNLVLEFDYADLELSTTYKFNNLDFYVADDSIKLDFETIKNFEFKTLSNNNVAKISNFEFLNSTLNSVDLKLNIDHDPATNLKDNELIFVEYKPINNDGSLGEAKKIQVTKQNPKTTISHLLPNQKYVITGVYTKENETKSSLLLSTNASINNTFGTTNTPISVDIQANNNKITLIDDDAAILIANYHDSDKKLAKNNTVTVILKDANNKIIKAEGIVKDNNLIKIFANNLLPNTSYEVSSIIANQLNEGSNHPYTFNPITNNKFTTLNNDTFLVSLSSNNQQPTNTNTVNATINVGASRNENQQVVLIYESVERNKTYISQPQTLIKNKQNYEFIFNNLDANTKYIYQKMVFVDNDDNLDNNVKIATANNAVVTNTFEIEPNITYLNNYTHIDALEINQNKVSFAINNNDNVLEIDQELEATAVLSEDLIQLASSNENQNPSLKAVGKLKMVNDQYVVEFTFNNIVLNKEYIIKEVKFVNKPNKAYFNLNNKQDNVIYSYINTKNNDNEHNGYIFENKFIIKNFANQEIQTNNTSTNDNRLILDLTVQGAQNLIFKAKYTALSDPNDVKYSEIARIENNNELVLVLNNLTPNRKYEFSELFATSNDDNNFNNKFIVNSNNQKNYVITQPSSTNLANAIISKTANSANIKLELNSADDVFENNQPINASFKIKQTDRDTPTQPFNVNGKVVIENNRPYIVFDLNNLDSNTTYELISANFINKPSKANANLNNNDLNNIYTRAEDNKIEFNTAEASFSILNVNSHVKEILDIQSNTNTITVEIQNDGSKLINKWIRVVYRSNDGIILKSQPIQIKNISNNPNETNRFDLILDQLLHSREYTFQDVEYSNSQSFDAFENVPKNQFEDKFKIVPKNITVTRFNYNVESINSASNSDVKFKIALDDPDNIISTNDLNSFDLLTVKFQKANVENTLQTKNDVSVKKEIVQVDGQEKEVKIIEFTIPNIENNVEYELVEVKFNDKPLKSAYNVGKKIDNQYSNIIYDINDDFASIFRVANYDVKSLFTANEPVNLNITLDRGNNNKLFNNKEIVVRVKDNNNQYYLSNTLSINQENNYTFSFNNLPHNRSYTIDGVYHKNNENTFSFDGNLTKIKNQPNLVANPFSVAPSKTTFVSSSDEWVKSSNYDSADIKLKISSLDEAFEINQNVKLIFGLNSGLNDESKIEVILPLKYNETDKWYIEANILNLKPNKEYKLYSANFEFANNSHPPKTITNLNNKDNNEIYNSNDENATLYTLTTNSAEFKLINISNSSDNDVYENKENVVINANFKIDGNVLENKRLRLVYVDQLNNEVVSNEVQVTSNQTNYDFTMNSNSLKHNTRYTLKQIDIIPSEESKSLIDLNDIASSFAIAKSNNLISVNNFEIKNTNQVDINKSNNLIRLNINDTDDILSTSTNNSDVVVVKYGINPSKPFVIEANLQQDGNDKFVEFTTNNLSLNRVYKIFEVGFKNKPINAYENVGQNNSNIIFDSSNASEQKTWENKLKITNVTASAISYNNTTPAKNSVDVTFQLEKTNGLLNNQYIKARYIAKDHEVWTNAVAVNSANEYVLTLENLIHNREYRFDGLYYANNENVQIIIENKLPKNEVVKSNLNNTSIITKPSLTRLSDFNETYKETTNKPKHETIIIQIESLDQAFSSGLSVVAIFDLNTQNNDTDSEHAIYASSVLERIENTNNWRVVYELNNLLPNSVYKLKKLQFATLNQKTITPIKPLNTFVYLNGDNNQSIVDLNNTNYTFTTSEPTTKVSAISYGSDVDVNNTNTVTLKLINDDPAVYNKTFKLEYISNDYDPSTEPNPVNGTRIISNAQSVVSSDGENSYTFRLEGLKANRQYTLSKIYFFDQNNTEISRIENELENVDAQKIKKSFTTTRNQIAASNLIQTQGQSYNQARLTIDLNDSNEVISNEKPLVTVRNKNTNELITIPQEQISITSKQNNNKIKLLTILVNNISLNQDYEIAKIEFANKPAKAFFNVGVKKQNTINNIVYAYDSSDFSNKLSAFKNEFKLITNTNWNNNASTFNFITTNTNLSGLYIHPVFKITRNDSITQTSDNQTVTYNKTNLINNQMSISVTNPIPNRKYVLSKLYFSNNPQPSNNVQNIRNIDGFDSLVNKQFTTAFSNSEVTSFNTSNLTSSAATFNLTINTSDMILANDQRVQILFTSATDPNHTKSIIAPLQQTNNKSTAYITATITDLRPNHKYILSSVSYTNSPLDLNNSINGNNNFYKTKNPNYAIQTVDNPLIINSIGFKNDLQNDIFDLANNKVVVNFSSIPTSYIQNNINKPFKLLYKVAGYENENDQTFETNAANFISNKQEYELSFDPNSITKNRKYVFVGIKVNENKIISKQNLNNNSNVLSNEFIVAKSGNVTIESFTQLGEYDGAKSKVKIVFNDPDDVLKAGRDVNIVVSPNETLLYPESLLNKLEHAQIKVSDNNEKYVEAYLLTRLDINGSYIKTIDIPVDNSSTKLEQQNFGYDNDPNTNKIYVLKKEDTTVHNYKINVSLRGFGINGNDSEIRLVDENTTRLNDISFSFNYDNLEGSSKEINDLWKNRQDVLFRIRYHGDNSRTIFTDSFEFSKDIVRNVGIELGQNNNATQFVSGVLDYKHYELIDGQEVWIPLINSAAPVNKRMRIQYPKAVVASNLTVSWIPTNETSNEGRSRNYEGEYLYKYAQNYNLSIQGLSTGQNNTEIDKSRKIKLKLRGTAILDENAFAYNKNNLEANKLNHELTIEVPSEDIGEITYTNSRSDASQRVININNLKIWNSYHLLAGYDYKLEELEFYFNDPQLNDKPFNFNYTNTPKNGTYHINSNFESDNIRDQRLTKRLMLNVDALEKTKGILHTHTFSLSPLHAKYENTETRYSTFVNESYFWRIGKHDDDANNRNLNFSNFSLDKLYTRDHFAKLFNYLSNEVPSGLARNLNESDVDWENRKKTLIESNDTNVYVVNEFSDKDINKDSNPMVTHEKGTRSTKFINIREMLIDMLANKLTHFLYVRNRDLSAHPNKGTANVDDVSFVANPITYYPEAYDKENNSLRGIRFGGWSHNNAISILNSNSSDPNQRIFAPIIGGIDLSIFTDNPNETNKIYNPELKKEVEKYISSNTKNPIKSLSFTRQDGSKISGGIIPFDIYHKQMQEYTKELIKLTLMFGSKFQ